MQSAKFGISKLGNEIELTNRYDAKAQMQILSDTASQNSSALNRERELMKNNPALKMHFQLRNLTRLVVNCNPGDANFFMTQFRDIVLSHKLCA